MVRSRRRVIGVETEAGERFHSRRWSRTPTASDPSRIARGAGAARARKFEPPPLRACLFRVVLYLGLNKAYDHLLHHDFVFSRDPREEFDFIYRKGEPAPDPTCYLASTARTEPETAPPGGDALYVLVHTPYLRPHHNWTKMLPEYRRVIIEKLTTTGKMPDIERRIVFESALSPQDIHNRYRVLNGAIYGLRSHGKWTGRSSPRTGPTLTGLYLAGGSAHPGRDADGVDVRVDCSTACG